MWLLGQMTGQSVDTPVPHGDAFSLWLALGLEIAAMLVTLPYFAFWIWMLIHCYRTEPDRQFWIWILLIAQPIGPIAYFILRYLPSKEFPTPAAFRRWTRGRELARLETAAEQIGNAHQFVQWGDALREVGLMDRAQEAYARALKKDGHNLQALWGAAQVAAHQKRYADVREFTRLVLDKDAQYKFGDVSLAHGKALQELKLLDAALAHLEQHVRRWRHPEAVYLLAKLYLDDGNTTAARQQLQGLIQDVNGSPTAIARKYGRWKSRANQMLRKLPS